MTVPRGTPDSVGVSDPPRWLTKREAAKRLGVDERTIERAAAAGRIGCQARDGFPTLYNPADVDLEAARRRRGVQPVILTADRTPNANGHQAIAQPRLSLEWFAQALVDRLAGGPTGPTGGPTGPTGPTPLPPLCTVAQAAAWLTISQADTRRLIAAGRLPVVPDIRVVRITRGDLEAFAARRLTPA